MHHTILYPSIFLYRPPNLIITDVIEEEIIQLDLLIQTWWW